MLLIEFARRERRKTLARLAEETKNAHHFLSLVEHGRAIPTEAQARRIGKALGVAPDRLLQPVVVMTEPETAEEATTEAAAEGR